MNNQYPSEGRFSPAIKIGDLLTKTMQEDPHFYFFSPDETTSNRFDKIFEVEKRAWAMRKEPWDLPEDENGRIVEMLSENVLFSVMTGHLANGEKAMMGSYEAFFPIITSQLLQQMKFIKQSKRVSWREPMPAVNLLSTSICWRQDHNGFTHQSPALISTLISVPSSLANCIFPTDDIVAEEVYKYMINSENVVNLTTFNKTEQPRFTNATQAKLLLEKGSALVLDQISDDEPDYVFASAGDIVTNEMVEAIKILKEDIPNIRIRLVNIVSLCYRGIGTIENKLSKEKFLELFTKDKPILANFHGYPETLENILENYTARGRLRVHGFNEEGSTTTPFEMLSKNAASRYDVALDVAKNEGREDLVDKYHKIMIDNHNHACEYGEDLIA